MNSMLAVKLAILCLSTLAQAQDNPASAYRGKLDYEKSALGRTWTAEASDVWMLDSFSYRLKGRLEINLGPSVAVIGKHETKKKGKNAVWAAVFALDLDSGEPIVASTPGHGDHLESAFLRFNPSLVGKLFPSKTIAGHAPPKWLMWAKRVYAHKINAGWQAENMPVIPWKHNLVFDVETVEGKRRYWSVDTKEKSLKYVAAFAERTLPEVPAIEVSKQQALEAFNEVWSSFDKEYPMFHLKPWVDWKILGEQYRKLAMEAATAYEVAGSIGLLLNHLQDLHVWVKVDQTWVPGFNRMRMLNANWEQVKSTLKNLHETSHGITWGEASHSIGYIVIWDLSSDGLVDAFDAALEGLANTKSLVLDLRFNGGGNENLGREIAGRFVEQEEIYSLNQYRNGDAHDQFGKVHERTVEPRGPWRYRAPVAVLIGQKTMSSAESLALMLAQCSTVTTMGDRSAGSSANPRRLEAGLGIVVNLPRWLDMDPNGDPIDAVGVQPMHPVKTPNYGDFAESDPVYRAALKHLKKAKGRKTGKQKG